MMDHQQQAKYRSLLLILRGDRQTQIRQSQEERAPVTVDGRMGRISRGDAMQVQQMAVEITRRRQQQLLRIKTALERLDDGSDGRCGRCQQAIATARLDAIPDDVLCVPCASVAKGS